MTNLRMAPVGQRGASLIELLAGVAVFSLLFLMVDSVFISGHRTARKVDLAAEVQQNARIAVDRLAREVRETGGSETPAAIRIGGTAGARAVVFKSARPAQPSTFSPVFCINVDSTSNPLHNAACNYYDPLPTDGVSLHLPVWQHYVGYYVTNGEEGYDLRRVVQSLGQPDESLPDPSTFSGGVVVASFVESLDVEWDSDNRIFRIILKAKGGQSAVVQGSSSPPQEVLLDERVLVRN